MADNLPPLPWNWVTSGVPWPDGGFETYLIDANGRKIADLWGTEKEAMADFILKCCNAAERSP